MPTVFICNYFIIFNPGFPLEFAFLFPYHRSEERRVGKEEHEVQWETWIEYDKVVADVDSGHISCDLASTWI